MIGKVRGGNISQESIKWRRGSFRLFRIKFMRTWQKLQSDFNHTPISESYAMMRDTTGLANGRIIISAIQQKWRWKRQQAYTRTGRRLWCWWESLLHTFSDRKYAQVSLAKHNLWEGQSIMYLAWLNVHTAMTSCHTHAAMDALVDCCSRWSLPRLEFCCTQMQWEVHITGKPRIAHEQAHSCI